jgi:hypothetical protein
MLALWNQVLEAVNVPVEAMPHWAGESVDGVKKVQPVAEIVRGPAVEAEQLLAAPRVPGNSP